MESASLYIHIPFCKKKCVYCDFFSKTCVTDQVLQQYTKALCKEIEFLSKKYEHPVLNTLYIGGGTPSLLPVNCLKEIESLVRANFKIPASSVFEATIELNPCDITQGLLQYLEESIFTRISVGIQSTDDAVLKTMNRRADAAAVKNALGLIKENFHKRVSLDAIAGFPGDTKESLFHTLESLVELNPDHISLYSLCVEEETPLYKMIEDSKVEYDFDTADELWLLGRNWLKEYGYFQYEVSNFARLSDFPDSCARHNLVYWHLKNYLGAGAGACGTVFDGHPERFTNTQDIQKYIDYWLFQKGSDMPVQVEELDEKTIEFEYLMMNFRLSQGVNSIDYRKRFGVDLEERIGTTDGVFRQWMDKGLAAVKGNNYFLTEEGLLFLNQFLAEL